MWILSTRQCGIGKISKHRLNNIPIGNNVLMLDGRVSFIIIFEYIHIKVAVSFSHQYIATVLCPC
jgi:hypothetical protein